jgi:hypothetical protein
MCSIHWTNTPTLCVTCGTSILPKSCWTETCRYLCDMTMMHHWVDSVLRATWHSYIGTSMASQSITTSLDPRLVLGLGRLFVQLATKVPLRYKQESTSLSSGHQRLATIHYVWTTGSRGAYHSSTAFGSSVDLEALSPFWGHCRLK